MSYSSSPVKKQKSESNLTSSEDAPQQYPSNSPPATPLREDSKDSYQSSDLAVNLLPSNSPFSPSLFGIAMTPLQFPFSQVSGLSGIMNSNGSILDADGHIIYENLPPMPSSRDWTPSMKNNLLPTAEDFTCFSDSQMSPPPTNINRKKLSSLPLYSSIGVAVGFKSPEGNFQSSDDSLENVRFSSSGALDVGSPQGSRISQPHLSSNKKALADRHHSSLITNAGKQISPILIGRIKGVKQRRPHEQQVEQTSTHRVTRLSSRIQTAEGPSSGPRSGYLSPSAEADDARSPVRRRPQSGIKTPLERNTSDDKDDSPDLIGDTSNMSGFAAITAAAESVDGGNNGYFKFAEAHSSKTVLIPNGYSNSKLSARFSPTTRSPVRSPTRSPLYNSMSSPLDLLGSVAAQHENFAEDFSFSQMSANDSHNLMIYDHQLSNESNSRLAYRTYSMDFPNPNSNPASENLNILNKNKRQEHEQEQIESNSNHDSIRSSSVEGSVRGRKGKGVKPAAASVSATTIGKKAAVAIAAPTPSASASSSSSGSMTASDIVSVIKSSGNASASSVTSIKKPTYADALSKARAEQHLLYLSPEVVVNLDKIGTLDKQSNPELVSCKCKKSRCLKMYCDCFRLQQYCRHCSCVDCANVEGQESLRAASIASIVERNPEAFKPRVLEDSASKSKNHLTGCRCRRSNCLKKYCECFTGNVICYDRCRCFECKNTNPEIFEIGMRLKSEGGSSSKISVASRTAALSSSKANAHSPDDDSLVGSRLEDIKAAADMIDSLKGPRQNTSSSSSSLNLSSDKPFDNNNNNNSSSSSVRKLSFQITSTPSVPTSAQTNQIVNLKPSSNTLSINKEKPSTKVSSSDIPAATTPMEKRFNAEGSMYRDAPNTASTVASTNAGRVKPTPLNLQQRLLQQNLDSSSNRSHRNDDEDDGCEGDNEDEEYRERVAISASLAEEDNVTGSSPPALKSIIL